MKAREDIIAVRPSTETRRDAALAECHIRRSMRCLVYGLLGLIPMAGLGTAILARQLFRQTRLELGAHRPATILDVGGGLLILAALTRNWHGQWILVLILLEFNLGLSALWYWREYRRWPYPDFNPARVWLFVGACLGHWGLLLSLPLIVYLIL